MSQEASPTKQNDNKVAPKQRKPKNPKKHKKIFQFKLVKGIVNFFKSIFSSKFCMAILLIVSIVAIIYVPIEFSIEKQSEIVNRNTIVQAYTAKDTFAVKVKDFRKELTAEELELDYDNDGIINSDEIANKTNIFRKDSNGDGVNDNFEANDTMTSYKKAVNDGKIDYAQYEEMLRKAAACRKVEIINRQGISPSTFIGRYNGDAFSGFNCLVSPFYLNKFTGTASIYSKNIRQFVKQHADYNDEYTYYDGKNKFYIVIVSYNCETDKYVVNRSNITFFTSQKDYDGEWFNHVEVSNTSDLPTAIIGVKAKSEQEIVDRFDSYSYLYTVMQNRFANKTIDNVVENKATSCYFHLPGLEDKYNLGRNYRLMNDFSKRCTDGGISLYQTSRIEELREIKNGLKNDDMNLSTEFKALYNSAYKSGDLSVYNSIKYTKMFNKLAKKNNLKSIKNIKSKGYLTDYVTSFDPTLNSFMFGNFKTDEAKGGVSFGMADVVSNYFNYQTLPAIEGVDTSSVETEFYKNGIASVNFIKPEKFIKGYQKAEIGSENLSKLLVEQSKVALNTPIAVGKHSNSVSVIDAISKDLESGKTVVAYIKNATRATAVVVYDITRNSFDPNEYFLKVYDPNYPNSSVTVYDEKTGETRSIYVDTVINLYVKNGYCVDDNNVVKRADKFTFEYGVDTSYSWGNTNKMKNGRIYAGGDIFFKVPVDLSKDNTQTQFYQ